jgi:hypothetical protein
MQEQLVELSGSPIVTILVVGANYFIRRTRRISLLYSPGPLYTFSRYRMVPGECSRPSYTASQDKYMKVHHTKGEEERWDERYVRDQRWGRKIMSRYNQFYYGGQLISPFAISLFILRRLSQQPIRHGAFSKRSILAPDTTR